MPEDLAERIRSLSPGALRLFKQQIATLPEASRQAVFSRLSGIPELEDITGQPAIPTAQLGAPTPQPQAEQAEQQEVPFWMKALQTVAKPIEWFQERVATPFAAGMQSSLFTKPGIQAEEIPGLIFGPLGWLAAYQPGTQARERYEAWQAPTLETGMTWPKLGPVGGGPVDISTKHISELLPWLAVPSATGVQVALRGGGKAAQVAAKAITPMVKAEQALAYPITKPIEVIGKKLLPSKTPPTATGLLADLQPVDDAIRIATEPSKLKDLVNINVGSRQPLKALGEMIAGRAATANNPAKFALVGRDVLRFEGANKALVNIATLDRMGPTRKLFGLDDVGVVAGGPLKGTHLNTIRTYPTRYIAKLTAEQKAWVKQASLLERAKKDLLDRYGIKVKELTFEEGGEYAGRRVFAKFDSQGELLDTAYLGVGQPGRPGAKAAFEKTRVFNTAEEAIAQGYRYLPEEEALYYNIVSAYNRVADKQWTNWFLERVPYRTVAVTGETAEAKVAMQGTKSALKQIENVAKRWHNNEPISSMMLKGIKSYYPKVYQRIYLAQKEGIVAQRAKFADELFSLVRNEEAAHRQQWSEIRKAFAEARRSAVRPGFTGTMASDIPAFAGKVFTGPEAKEWVRLIRKELDPQFNSALNAINQVNAVGRYFALAGDVSPFGIQLIFLAGAHPKIYGRAMKGFVNAMFDPEFSAKYLAKHIDTVNMSPSMVLTKGGTTEMTEAMARGGLLRKGPLKLMGKVLEPFMRGFETALDVAGIELKECYRHLATTPARNAQIDAFINEIRGVMNTQRLGISSTQRQLERAIILAPQYNRAVGALLTDIARGGLRGSLARKAIAKGVGAIMAMTIAVSYAMGENEDEIVDHLNPLSHNFMTWEIAGQRIGPGSKVRSLLFTFGKMIKNPEDTGYHAGRFMRGNFAPFLGTSIDLITGKDYIGDPTRDGLPNLTKTVLGENLLPIWVQSVAFEGGDLAGRVTRALAEFGGARGYPIGAYGELKNLQNELAQKTHGIPWEDLNNLQRIKIDRESPELQTLSNKAAEESTKWARGDQIIWNEYTRRGESINQRTQAEIELASKQFQVTRDGSHFRERINRAFWAKAQEKSALLEEDEFALIQEYYSEPLSPEQIAKKSPQDLAYMEYNRIMYSPDMFDEFGEYRFAEADRQRTLFTQKYGVETLDYIEEIIGEKRADEPIELKMLREARKILEPYWKITDAIWNLYPPQLKELSDQIKILERTNPVMAERVLYRYPQILRARELIAQYKKKAREQNPRINQAYRMYYSY